MRRQESDDVPQTVLCTTILIEPTTVLVVRFLCSWQFAYKQSQKPTERMSGSEAAADRQLNR